MTRVNMLSNAYALWKEIKKSKKEGTSLRLRLFIFLAFFLFAILSGLLIILLLSGILNGGLRESKTWTENELTHLSTNVSTMYDRFSLQGIKMAEKISISLNKEMTSNHINAATLSEHPEILESLLDSQISTLYTSMKSVGSSGAFLMLNATVNPSLENSKNSRSGLFLKNTLPDTLNSVDANVRYLRGPASLARTYGYELLGQWKMEFDISNEPYWDMVMYNATNSSLPLSRLYYWSNRIQLVDNSEPGMLLIVPLMDADGVAYGVCGFEISSMLFKLSFSPDNVLFSRIFCTLAPFKDNRIDTTCGMIAGNSYTTNGLIGQTVEIAATRKTFNAYTAEDGLTYSGIHQNVSLYPKDSAYENENWLLCILMPEEDLEMIVMGKNKAFFLALFFFLVICLGMASYISRRFISPVLHALSLLKTKDHSTLKKTRILEIDDLLDYLSAHDEKESSSSPAYQPNLKAYQEFVHNISSLSPAERAVFNLYMEGHTASEITQILFLSINTIKTHNKRIYEKLNVTSRKELMVYVQMMLQSETE